MLNLSAQEMFGLAMSNYAGNNGWKLNPGNLADSRLKWDVNIVGMDLFLKNDYVYMPNGTFTIVRLIDGGGVNAVAKDRYAEPPKNLNFSSNVMLPSALVSFRKHTFGFRTGVRTMLNMNKVPFHVAKWFYDGLDYEPQHNQEYKSGYFSAAGMAWMEMGLSYSGVIVNHRRQFLSAGFNLNFLRSPGGAFVESNNLTYMVPNQDTIIVNNTNTQIGSSYTGNGIDKLIAGSGTGVDVGITYQRKREYNWTSIYKRSAIQTYDYRFGVSLIDFGNVKFSDGGGFVDIQDKGDTLPASHIGNIDSGIDMDTTLNSDFNKVSTRPLSSFQIGLPTAISLQYDRNLTDYWYWNLALVYNLTNYGSNLTRTKQLCFAMRYESKWIEFALPFSLYNLEKPHLGFSFRFHSFFIGSDNILPLLGVGRIYGGNFYFGFKISAFKERWTMKDKSAYLNTFGGIFKPFWRRR